MNKKNKCKSWSIHTVLGSTICSQIKQMLNQQLATMSAIYITSPLLSFVSKVVKGLIVDWLL